MEEITAKNTTEISISVISHGQIHLIEGLLHDINKHCNTSSLQLILTLNLDEILPFAEDSFSFPMEIIRNKVPLGFAANHNQAFAHAKGRFFCVMNPDIRLDDDPFPVEDGTCDACILDNVLEHIEDPCRTLDECYRITKENGGLVIAVPGLRGFESDADHKKFYDAEALRSLDDRWLLLSLFSTPFLIGYVALNC